MKTECREEQRLQGKVYPRSCGICGFGPCREGYTWGSRFAKIPEEQVRRIQQIYRENYYSITKNVSERGYYRVADETAEERSQKFSRLLTLGHDPTVMTHRILTFYGEPFAVNDGTSIRHWFRIVCQNVEVGQVERRDYNLDD